MQLAAHMPWAHEVASSILASRTGAIVQVSTLVCHGGRHAVIPAVEQRARTDGREDVSEISLALLVQERRSAVSIDNLLKAIDGRGKCSTCAHLNIVMYSNHRSYSMWCNAMEEPLFSARTACLAKSDGDPVIHFDVGSCFCPTCGDEHWARERLHLPEYIERFKVGVAEPADAPR